jgi:hypothetical protein
VQPNQAARRITRPPNKGMKQTSVEHIERSQLIPGVRPTTCGAGRTNADGLAPLTESPSADYGSAAGEQRSLALSMTELLPLCRTSLNPT